jgi:hypothetical protein
MDPYKLMLEECQWGRMRREGRKHEEGGMLKDL